MADRKLLAYAVHDGDEASVVTFACSNAQARREGASILGIDFSSVDYCRRSPEFDAYAPGPVPERALYEAGWQFTCFHCDARVAEDEENDGRTDEDGFPRDPAEFGFYQRGQRVFCCQRCVASFDAEQRLKAAQEAATIEAVALRWPMATDIRPGEFRTGWSKKPGCQPGAYLTLPGIQDPVQWLIGSSEAMVTVRTRDEFVRLYGVKDEAPA